MTLEAMLGIVRILSNSCWVRWWAHWNYPQLPWKIAFCPIDHTGTPAMIDETGLKNYQKIEHLDGLTYYVFDRLNEDGTPFTPSWVIG